MLIQNFEYPWFDIPNKEVINLIVEYLKAQVNNATQLYDVNCLNINDQNKLFIFLNDHRHPIQIPIAALIGINKKVNYF